MNDTRIRRIAFIESSLFLAFEKIRSGRFEDRSLPTILILQWIDLRRTHSLE